MLTKLLAALDDDQRQMEQSVFASPPQDWAAFQRRMGEWIGVEEARKRILSMIEDDKQRDDGL